MEESTLRWPTDKEREEMEEVCSIGEVPHTEKRLAINRSRVRIPAAALSSATLGKLFAHTCASVIKQY